MYIMQMLKTIKVMHSVDVHKAIKEGVRKAPPGPPGKFISKGHVNNDTNLYITEWYMKIDDQGGTLYHLLMSLRGRFYQLTCETSNTGGFGFKRLRELTWASYMVKSEKATKNIKRVHADSFPEQSTPALNPINNVQPVGRPSIPANAGSLNDDDDVTYLANTMAASQALREPLPFT